MPSPLTAPWPQLEAAANHAARRYLPSNRTPAWVTELTRYTMRLAFYRATHHPTRPPYAWPSTTHLARHCSVTRETISRWLPRLQRAGLIRVIHRRQRNGRWQTNLYLLGRRLWRFLTHAINAGRRPATDSGLRRLSLHAYSRASVTEPSHGEPNAPPRPPNPEFDQLIQRWLARGTTTPQTTPHTPGAPTE